MPFDIETGRIDFIVSGNNASIKRKNKIIPLPSASVKNKLIEEFQKTKNNSKLTEFEKKYPKLMDGDILITGKNTKIHISINYNKGKDKPNKDYKDRISKTIYMCSNSELELSGFEKWDILNSKTNERKFGELIKEIYLKKGFFHTSYSNTDDPIQTPVASITFNGSSSGFFDVYEDKVYSSPQSEKGVLYTNLKTKKTFLAKAQTPEEIIVTQDSIYRRGFVGMDEIFQNKIQLFVSIQNILSEASGPKIDPKMMGEQMKNMGGNMEQSFAGLDVLKQMTPQDMERLMKMSGHEVTPEMKKQLEELPLLMKKMEDENLTEKMQKAAAQMKGFSEGIGSENIDKFMKISERTNLEKTKKVKEITQNVDEMLEKPRQYKPLTKEFGATKVG